MIRSETYLGPSVACITLYNPHPPLALFAHPNLINLTPSRTALHHRKPSRSSPCQSGALEASATAA